MPPPDDHGAYRRASSTFAHVLSDAIADLSERGYVSREQIDMWLALLRAAAERELGSEDLIERRMRDAFGAIYKRLIERGRITDYVPGVGRYTLAMIAPELRAELDRRILASADLIRLNRREAIEKTLQRFAGWSTAIPPGGVSDLDRREAKASIGKSVKQFAFERRRVAIDQGHKLVANIASITAVANGAIAGAWHSHVHQIGYQVRPDHADRDVDVRRKAGKPAIYAIRGSWADKQGLINRGAGYLDDMTAAGQEVLCRCYVTYLTSLRRVPDEMLTRKGQEWLAQADARRTAA